MKKIIISGLLVAIVIMPIALYSVAVQPKSNSERLIPVQIELGSSLSSIAKTLESSGVIRNALAFRIYTKLNKLSGFQAGFYELSASLSMGEICTELKNGKIMSKDQVTITFIDGKNMRWIASKIAKETNNTEDDVYRLLEDRSYISSLIAKYPFLSNEIENTQIYYPLEGYLFPDTYNFENRDVDVEAIFDTLLGRMGEILDKYKDLVNSSKYSVHEILTMASVVNMEAPNKDDMPKVASVFFNRLNSGMNLGSDPTTYYAAKVDLAERDLKQTEISARNAYNTRGPDMISKLPVGPICSPCEAAIKAALAPSEGEDALFFVSDKNGKLYFTKTNSEHSKVIRDLKSQGLWFEYK